MERKFAFAATGDSIIARRIHGLGDEALEALVSLIKSADAAFTNVELVTPRPGTPAAAEYGGIHLGMPPYVLDELKLTGFNLFNLAHNHALDFGQAGLLETMKEMGKKNMVFAGVGRTLGEARMPSYIETPGGRVALIATASTYTTGAQAGASRLDFPGRPGINPLRHKQTNLVTPEQLEQIIRIDEAMGTAEVRRRERSFGLSVVEDQEEAYTFLGHRFMTASEPGTKTEANQRDLEDIMGSIHEARRQGDYVIVSLHGHEGPAGQINGNRPADFIVQFARACISAGADVFVGHGPHMLQGIEIYQGKPIFYSLGNFMFMCEQLTRLPQEMYDLYAFPPSANPGDIFDFESQDANGCPKAFHADGRFWETVLPVCTFTGNQLSAITLHPVTLQLEQRRTRRGVPRLADQEQGVDILHRLHLLSQSMGTTIETLDGPGGPVGKVKL